MSLRPDQPQSIGGVLDTTFQLYRAALVRVLPISALSVVASSLPSIYLLTQAPRQADPDNPLAALEVMQHPAYLTLNVVTLLVSLWVLAALFAQMDAIGNERPMSIGAALSQAGRRVPSILLMSFLFGLALLIGLILLIIPGLILMVSLFPSYCLVVLEGKGPMKSLIGSHRLVWGNWWRTTAVLSVGFIILLVIYFIGALLVAVILPFTGLAAGSEFLAGQLGGLVIVAAMTLLGTPFYVSLLITTYWDLKLRKEGGDLAARVGMLDTTP